MRVAVDIVMLTIRTGRLQVLLVRRGIPPHQDRWALPGGFVHDDEGLDAAARRELHEETAIRTACAHLEQLATYGDPGRDPRGRVVSVAHLALLPEVGDPTGGSDAAAARWWSVRGDGTADDGAGGALPLAFDHARILADGVERARSKLEYTPLGTTFCAPEFTIAELRRAYEIVWGHELDPRNFHRKVTTTAGFVAPVGRTTTRGGGRPAQLYRPGDADVLYPPLLRGDA